MRQALHRASLVPPEFVVESAYYEGDKAVIAVRASGSVGLCPSCGTVFRRTHSRYRRRVTDLPLAGRVVDLLVIARRFRCDAILCGCQIFTERFAEEVLAPSTRRYGEAAAKALPQAVQVADRWHLMENASRAFLDAGRKSMRQIGTVIGATTIDPKLLTAAERLQYEGYLRREETNAAILALSKHGLPIKQIVSQTCHSRKLVRQVIRGERNDVFRTRKSSLDLHLPWLDDQWASGCRNGLNFGAA